MPLISSPIVPQSVIYDIQALTEIFRAALTAEQQKEKPDWSKDFSGATSLKTTVAWLEAQKKAGFNSIRSEMPLTDGTVLGNVEDSLFMQIHYDRVVGIHVGVIDLAIK